MYVFDFPRTKNCMYLIIPPLKNNGRQNDFKVALEEQFGSIFGRGIGEVKNKKNIKNISK